MVRAILAGRKSQTRRVIKPQPECGSDAERSPYGVPGDRLWVRETLRGAVTGAAVRYAADSCPIFRDGETPDVWPWQRPILSSIFMPRWASRITLAVTGVRVQRVQEITEGDALSEGVVRWDHGPLAPMFYPSPERTSDNALGYDSAVNAYGELWDAVNAKRGHGWETNPWVWAITFRRITQ